MVLVTAAVAPYLAIWRAKRQEIYNKHPFLANTHGAVSGDGAMDLVIGIAIGLFALAYVLPPAMSALGGANTTNWPTGTSAFIPVIGIFVMIALLVHFANARKK